MFSEGKGDGRSHARVRFDVELLEQCRDQVGIAAEAREQMRGMCPLADIAFLEESGDHRNPGPHCPIDRGQNLGVVQPSPCELRNRLLASIHPQDLAIAGKRPFLDGKEPSYDGGQEIEDAALVSYRRLGQELQQEWDGVGCGRVAGALVVDVPEEVPEGLLAGRRIGARKGADLVGDIRGGAIGVVEFSPGNGVQAFKHAESMAHVLQGAVPESIRPDPTRFFCRVEGWFSESRRLGRAAFETRQGVGSSRCAMRGWIHVAFRKLCPLDSGNSVRLMRLK